MGMPLPHFLHLRIAVSYFCFSPRLPHLLRLTRQFTFMWTILFLKRSKKNMMTMLSMWWSENFFLYYSGYYHDSSLNCAYVFHGRLLPPLSTRLTRDEKEEHEAGKKYADWVTAKCAQNFFDAEHFVTV